MGIKNILDSFHIKYMGWFKAKKPSHANVPLTLKLFGTSTYEPATELIFSLNIEWLKLCRKLLNILIPEDEIKL
jgi:hypothetical protein